MKDNIYIKSLKIGLEQTSGISFNQLVEKLKIKFEDKDQKVNFIIWFYSNFYNEKGEAQITGHFTAPSTGYKIANKLNEFETINDIKAYIKGEALNKYIDYLELERTRKSSRRAFILSLIAVILTAIGVFKPFQYFKTNEQPNKTQIEFERILGNENSETLTYLVKDFEDDFLRNQYPNLELKEAYKKFLTELRDNKTDNWKKISEESINQFSKSNLKLEIFSYPDSVWIEKDTSKLILKSAPMIKRKYKYLANSGQFEYRTSESTFNYTKNINQDSIIELHKTWRDINYVGKFWQALSVAGKDDEFIVKYLDMINAAGSIDPLIMSSEMLDSELDYSNYLIKRIIIIEFTQ